MRGFNKVCVKMCVFVQVYMCLCVCFETSLKAASLECILECTMVSNERGIQLSLDGGGCTLASLLYIYIVTTSTSHGGDDDAWWRHKRQYTGYTCHHSLPDSVIVSPLRHLAHQTIVCNIVPSR